MVKFLGGGGADPLDKCGVHRRHWNKSYITLREVSGWEVKTVGKMGLVKGRKREFVFVVFHNASETS